MNISITSKCLLLAMCNPSWPLSSTLFYLLLQFSCWVVSDSLRPHGLQHTRLPSPCLSPRVCSNGLMSVKLVMPSKHLILCCPLFHLPSVFPSIKVSFTELALHIRWPKCWRFSFSFSPSNEYSGLISLVFWQYPSVLRCSVLCSTFFPFFFPLFVFQSGKFLLTYIHTHWFFLGHVLSTNEIIRGILHFCYNSFDF